MADIAQTPALQGKEQSPFFILNGPMTSNMNYEKEE